MARLAGSASLVLVDGATPLRPEPALFDTMVEAGTVNILPGA